MFANAEDSEKKMQKAYIPGFNLVKLLPQRNATSYINALCWQTIYVQGNILGKLICKLCSQ